MGIKTTFIKATKITMETTEGILVLDPISVSASKMEGMEEYGITFDIKAKVSQGKLVFK